MVTSRVYDSLDRADKRAYVRLLPSAPSLPASAGLSHAPIFLSVGARGARLAFGPNPHACVTCALVLCLTSLLKTPLNARTFSMLLECTLTRQHAGVER